MVIKQVQLVVSTRKSSKSVHDINSSEEIIRVILLLLDRRPYENEKDRHQRGPGTDHKSFDHHKEMSVKRQTSTMTVLDATSLDHVRSEQSPAQCWRVIQPRQSQHIL